MNIKCDFLIHAMNVCCLLRYFLCLHVYLSVYEQILVVIYFPWYALGYKHRKKDILWIWCQCTPSYAPARVWPSSLAIDGDEQVHHIALIMFHIWTYMNIYVSYMNIYVPYIILYQIMNTVVLLSNWCSSQSLSL